MLIIFLLTMAIIVIEMENEILMKSTNFFHICLIFTNTKKEI